MVDKRSEIEKNSNLHWVNGEFTPANAANIPILTHALHYASAVFEGERAYDGKIFKLNEHNERLHRSANMLGLKLPYSVAELNKATVELLERNKLKNAYVRPLAWCGGAPFGIASNSCKINVAISMWHFDSYFLNKDKGIKLAWAEWIRPAPFMAPVAAKASALYMIGSLSKNKAEEQGFDDALMLDYRGYIAECTGANFFVVKRGILYTPIADCFLNGITRQTIIALARNLQIPLVEKHLYPDDLEGATEAFITGSAVEVTPVSQIGNLCFYKGEITTTIMQAYSDLVHDRNEMKNV